MSTTSIPSETTRGKGNVRLFPRAKLGSARGRSNVASDWAGFCAIIIERWHELRQIDSFAIRGRAAARALARRSCELQIVMTPAAGKGLRRSVRHELETRHRVQRMVHSVPNCLRSTKCRLYHAHERSRADASMPSSL